MIWARCIKCYQHVPLTAYVTIMCMSTTLSTPINMVFHLKLRVAKNNYHNYTVLNLIRQTTTCIVVSIVNYIDNKESTLKTLGITLWVHVI